MREDVRLDGVFGSDYRDVEERRKKDADDCSCDVFVIRGVEEGGCPDDEKGCINVFHARTKSPDISSKPYFSNETRMTSLRGSRPPGSASSP